MRPEASFGGWLIDINHDLDDNHKPPQVGCPYLCTEIPQEIFLFALAQTTRCLASTHSTLSFNLELTPPGSLLDLLERLVH